MTPHGFLALAPQYTTTSELLSAAARRRGMEVEALSPQGAPPSVADSRSAHYYGGPGFAERVVGALGVALLEPVDDWLVALPRTWTGRRITMATLEQARALTRPAFVKPPRDKCFPAAVYSDGNRLPVGPELAPDIPVQISETVSWAAEFRLFVLDGEVRTGSQYATYGRLDAHPLRGHRDEHAVLEFARGLLAGCGDTLPSAVVVDVGRLTTPERPAEKRWAVVEANMAWFSNCYAAEPDRVLDVVLRSAGPRARLGPRDQRFWRGSGGDRPGGRPRTGDEERWVG
ncbi:ATP-grasp domain-containing protein [Streptomyces sp. NPDC046860]|uniref:ATP-grasp domain-containing protein n=1 Tax=Streptomyces sp. NPDC046860 TaxID=3154495 RepID=UPI0033C448AC